MNVLFHPEAEREFLDAIDYYEDQAAGLGESFYVEIMAAIARITQGTMTWPVLDGDVRRCLAHRFPFGVLYSIEEHGVYVLAVMPLRRDPDYWKDRSRERDNQ